MDPNTTTTESSFSIIKKALPPKPLKGQSERQKYIAQLKQLEPGNCLQYRGKLSKSEGFNLASQASVWLGKKCSVKTVEGGLKCSVKTVEGGFDVYCQ